MAKRVIEDATLQSIAEAIREKAKTTEGMTPLQMPQAILDIKGAEIAERDNPSGGKTVYINSEAPEEAGLPEGFTRLKWIQSDGRQYVDTLFKPNNNTRVVLDVNILSADVSFLFGARVSSSRACFGMAVTSATTVRIDYANSTTAMTVASSIGMHTVDMNRNSFKFDNASRTQSEATFDVGYNLLLLSMNTAGTAGTNGTPARVSSSQVYDNGTIVRNYIPCLNASGESGLWDTVTQAFFGDAAGVGFIAGPVVLDYTLPEGFEELPWIESDGRQYVNTGFNVNQNTRFVADAQFTSKTTQGHLASATDGTYYWTLYVSTSGTIGSRYGSETYRQFAANQPAWNDRLLFDKNKTITTIGGYSVTASESTFSIAYPLTLFGRNTSGAIQEKGSAKLYFCQIYDNGTLVRYYVPCRTNNGEVGLWDVVHEVFYGDVTGVGFIAGPVVGNSVSKVVLEDEVLIDLTGDTVTPEGLLAGLTAHDASGAQIIGELVQKEKGKSVVTGTFTGNNSRQFSLSGLNFTPQGVAIFGSETRASTTVLSLWCYGSVEEYQYARTSYDTTSFDAYYEAQKQSVTSFNTTAGSVQISINSGSFYSGVSFQYVVWGE